VAIATAISRETFDRGYVPARRDDRGAPLPPRTPSCRHGRSPHSTVARLRGEHISAVLHAADSVRVYRPPSTNPPTRSSRCTSAWRCVGHSTVDRAPALSLVDHAATSPRLSPARPQPRTTITMTTIATTTNGTPLLPGLDVVTVLLLQRLGDRESPPPPVPALERRPCSPSPVMPAERPRTPHRRPAFDFRDLPPSPATSVRDALQHYWVRFAHGLPTTRSRRRTRRASWSTRRAMPRSAHRGTSASRIPRRLAYPYFRGSARGAGPGRDGVPYTVRCPLILFGADGGSACHIAWLLPTCRSSRSAAAVAYRIRPIHFHLADLAFSSALDTDDRIIDAVRAPTGRPSFRARPRDPAAVASPQPIVSIPAPAPTDLLRAHRALLACCSHATSTTPSDGLA